MLIQKCDKLSNYFFVGSKKPEDRSASIFGLRTSYLAVVFLSLFFSSMVLAQSTIDVNALMPDKEFDNVFVKKIYSDTNTTSFIIWVKKEVKSHQHLSHTENIKIIEGTGEMTVGKETFLIKSGYFFVVPPNTFHAVKVTSTTPLKLISIQSPNFNGEDRIFEEKQ